MASIKELTAQIEKLDVSLAKLQSKAQAVNADMSSGHWGVEQVKALEKEFAKLNDKITSISNKRMKLVDEASTRDLEILMKQIGTLESKLSEKRLNIAGIDETTSRFTVLNDEINRLQNGLKSLEGRKFTQFNALGYRKSQSDRDSFGDINMEARLGPRNPQYTYADADILSRIGARAGAVVNPSVVNSIAGGADVTAKATQITGMDAELNKLEKMAPGTRRSATSAIAALEQLGLTLSEINKVKFGKGFISAQFKGLDVDGVQRDAKMFMDGMGNYGRSLREMRNMAFGKNPDNAKLIEEARKAGYTIDDRLNTRSEGAGAYNVTRFQKTDEQGLQQRHDFRVDKQGGVSMAPVGKQYQSFTQGIGKDIGDLLKWSVAISAIYGPINAMSEAMSQLIENESKLADVSIALNPDVADTGKVFDAVNTSARASGEAISGVIDAFGAAFTAAGRITDGTQRYAATVKLLDDSLVLSKLSTLDQAGAIDVLTSALYQTGDANDTAAEKLSRGRDLIDQWIAVSKIASVSVETLATGVAVLGDSAETAGLSLEQLNALVATISEVSLSSGKETANIAKALIGNYQQESAVKELNRLGIAVVDTTGKTRQFLDVMKDVAALRSQGLLGDQDFGRLTLALGGGGIRRQKDVSSFIENFGRMEQIAGMQGGSGGSSAEAMAKKLDTVQTSSTNLSNSFVNLAQTLGDEGGLLDAMSGTLKVGTFLVDIFDKLAEKVGRVGPLLAVVAASSLLIGKGGLPSITDKLATNFTNPLAQRFGFDNGNALAGNLTGARNPFGLSTSSTLGRATTIPSLAAIALPAAQNFLSGNTKEAGANIAGGIAGALIGGPVGALVGSAIAEAFVRTTITYKSEFADLFAGQAADVSGGKLITPDGLTNEELNKEAFTALGGGQEWFGKMRAKIAQTFNAQKLDIVGNPFFSDTNKNKYNTPGAAALEALKKEDPELYRTLMSKAAINNVTPEGTTTRLTNRQKEITDLPGQSSYLKSLQKEEQDNLRNQMITGKIKPSDYSNRLSSVSAFSVTAPRYMAAMESQVGGIGDAFKTTEDAYRAFLEILSSGNQESINNINSQIATIDQLQNIWDTWDPKAKTSKFTINGVEADWTKDQLKEAIDNANSGLGIATKDAAQQARLQGLETKNPVGGMQVASRPEDVRLIAQEAARLDKIQYANLKKEDFTALKESWETVSVLMEESGKEFVKDVKVAGENISKENYSAAKQRLEESGAIQKSGGGVDWQVGQATKAQYLDAERRAPEFTKMLESKGYSPKIEDTIITTSDKQTIVSHGDQKVIQYLLQQILDTEKKQLQGIWNLPEGSSFWVPLQSMIAGDGTGTGTDVVPGEDGKVASGIVNQGEFKTPPTNGFTADDPFIKEIAKIAEAPFKTPPTNGFTSKDPFIKSDESSSGSDSMSLIDQLIAKLSTLFTPGVGGLAGFTGVGQGIGSGNKTGQSGFLGGKGYSPSDNSASQQQTKMDIRFTATTNLMVDGRVLASIVKPYLAADLLKTNESGGTITRSYVI